MNTTSAQLLQQEISKEIHRAHTLYKRLLAQLGDGDLPQVDRETAEKRARLAIKTARQLEHTHSRLVEVQQ